MNAVMPGHSPQFAAPYGGGLADGIDPENAHYNNETNAITNNNNNNNNTNNNTNSVNRTNNGASETHDSDNPERNNMENTKTGNVEISPGHQRHVSASTTASPPQEYMPQQQQQQQQQQHPSPFGLGNPSPPVQEPMFHTPSFPWSIGSTDGSFAMVHLQQQQQQLQMQQQQEELQRRREAAQNNNNNNSNNSNSNLNNGSTTSSLDVDSGKSDAPEPPSNEPSPAIAQAQQAIAQSAQIIQSGRSLYHDKLFHQSSSAVEGVLAASCDAMGFDIAEMWLRTGLKTHQLTNSHLRPTALQDSVRQDLVDVYYGERSNERTHRLSPALCKRAKDANDVVWVTAHTQTGAEALRMSISNVRTAVAVPICHEASNTNVTIIYFSIRRIVLRPAAVEFLIHMSLSAAVTAVNALSTDGLIDRPPTNLDGDMLPKRNTRSLSSSAAGGPFAAAANGLSRTSYNTQRPSSISYRRPEKTSVTGARLDLQWRQLMNVEYLTDGGNSWIHTAVFDGKPVVVKTLRPECQDTAVAINEIESEVAVHSRVNHPNIVKLIGAGWTSKKVRFIVLERLDGGTLTQMLGYDTRIRDRRRRFWRKKQLPYLDVLRCARSMACAMDYCHSQAIPGSMVLHRDLKPDNIGFTLDGQVKVIDFGLARVMENVNSKSNDVYEMSGETGSLRYMAPEVAEGLPYNHKADVYSFGIIFWEMNAGKRPFSGLSRDTFYEQVVHGGGRPHLSKKWPSELNKLIADCWNVDVDSRPTFEQIVDRIDELLTNEKGGKPLGAKNLKKRVSGIIDRHSTWF